MDTYSKRLREHLAAYKRVRLGVKRNGVWVKNCKKYPHILPRKLYRLNILETIRLEIWAHTKVQPLKRHRDFHHLNSSQAMAFNLFFPFFGLSPGQAGSLLAGLGIEEGQIADWAFERVVDAAEGTNFDFYLKFLDGRTVYFEVKLCESGFGAAKRNQGHQDKLTNLYSSRLAGKVWPECLAEDVFFENYQLLRNVSYTTFDKTHALVVIVPKANTSLSGGLTFLGSALTEACAASVRVLYLEEVLAGMRSNAPSDCRLATHLQLFEEKYVI